MRESREVRYTVEFERYIDEERVETYMLIHASVTPGTPSQLSGPPEKCYEGDAPEIELLEVVSAGPIPLTVEMLSEEEVEMIMETALLEYEVLSLEQDDQDY